MSSLVAASIAGQHGSPVAGVDRLVVRADHVPHHEDIVVYATGWAGKFVPLMGRILTDLALDGHTPFDISHFQLGHTFFHRTMPARRP